MSEAIYPYFYPLTSSCPVRSARALENGYVVVDETELAQKSEPLFSGHDQPLIYSLGDLATTQWDDMSREAIAAQNELALEFKVDGFIFDTFLGIKEGRRFHEMGGVLDDVWLQDKRANQLKFGIMSILASPRIALPVSNTAGYREASRDYDISRKTVEAIVDHAAANYWEQDNYIRLRDRPYVSMFIPLNRLAAPQDDLMMPEVFEYLKDYSSKKYHIDPYLVAIAQESHQAASAIAKGADAASSYALLPNFGNSAAPLQQFSNLLDQRIDDWRMIAKDLSVPYVPPVVAGWDASARGVNGVTLEEVAGIYPFTPIVQGATPELFEKMLREQAAYLENIDPADRYIPINAWNEVPEGSSLLPRVRDGMLDFSLLNAIKSYKENF